MGYEAERKRNPLIRSGAGARALNAIHRPWFTLRLPRAYGELTTTGRKSGKARRRYLRAVRRGNKVYVVAIKGADSSGWAKNLQANPKVRLRIRDGTFEGTAREVSDAEEAREGREAYCEMVGPFEQVEYTMWRKGRPTAAKIRELHRAWFEQGTPLVIELSD
jgi:deazaflavin-dependent oxidoreductase (nitroreductase family)